MYEKILVPTDGSEASMAAVDEAAALADALGSSIHVLSVVESERFAPMDVSSPDLVASMEGTAEEVVERAVTRAREAGAADVEGTVESGIAHRAIVSYVEDNDVDLVVMGTHGRTGLDRVLLGSVAEKVVRLSPVPVLTVGSAESQDE